MSTHDLIQLAYVLDMHGVVGSEAAVRHVVRAARAAGIDTPAIGVLADTTAPEVARLRAFALVSAALASTQHRDRQLAGAA